MKEYKEQKKRRKDLATGIAVLDQSYFPPSRVFVRMPTSEAEMLLNAYYQALVTFLHNVIN